ncbi:tautomerase family protein [Marinobacterium arenosum]|uniref:tautomerase family protein n=1 Tax=Marinobacterium arenosum TaxID=2862496 RepID=UPI001C95E6A2|nr:tautomerase family protein [Marinobacterium arenosum]MBY4677446.1 tautomerase family protein [Marinobacterium arenosum]
MPHIAFESGQLPDAVKQKLIECLTQASADITGIPEAMFMVSIRELPDDNLALGGKTVTQLKQQLR